MPKWQHRDSQQSQSTQKDTKLPHKDEKSPPKNKQGDKKKMQNVDKSLKMTQKIQTGNNSEPLRDKLSLLQKVGGGLDWLKSQKDPVGVGSSSGLTGSY